MRNMENKSINSNTKRLAFTGVMLAVILAMQAANLPNLITGVFVNAIYIFVDIYAGRRDSLLLCFLGPFGGILSGHMAPFMLPIVPVIIIGNMVLVFLYDKLKAKTLFYKLVIPSLVKAVIIGAFGYLAIVCISPSETTNWLLLPVLGIQFFTAVPGIWIGLRLSSHLKAA